MNRRKFLGGLAGLVAGAGALLVGGRKIEDDPIIGKTETVTVPHGNVTITGLTADQPYKITISPVGIDHDHDGVNSYKRRPLKGRQMTVWYMDEASEVATSEKWESIRARMDHNHR